MEDAIDLLRLNAANCRDLASYAITIGAREVLNDLADQYEKEAASIESGGAHRHRRPAFKWTIA